MALACGLILSPRRDAMIANVGERIVKLVVMIQELFALWQLTLRLHQT